MSQQYWKTGARKLAALAVIMALGIGAAGCDDQGPTAEQHLQKARESIESNEWRTAVIELKNAIQKEPELAEARLMLGRTYVELGSGTDAEKELLRARDLGADPQAVQIALADAWLLQGENQQVLDFFKVDEDASKEMKVAALIARGKAYAGLGQLDKADQALNYALSLDINNIKASVALVYLNIQRGDTEQAGLYLANPKKIAPEDIQVLVAEGDLALSTGRNADAEAAFAKVAKKVPGDRRYTLSLARAQIANGSLEPAIENLDAVLKRAPRHPFANYWRAVAALQQQDYETVKSHAQQVLAVAPDHLPSILLLGTAHYALGEDEQAIERLQTYVARNPEYAPARRTLGQALLRTGDAEQARRVLEPLEAAATNDAQLLAMIATAAVRSGDLRAGEAYLKKLTDVAPESAKARAQLGAIRISLGETEEGIDDLEKSLATEPDIRALVILCVTHLRNKEFDRALDAATRLSEEYPDNPAGPTLAGIAQAGKGSLDQARAAFERALEIKPGAPDASANLAAMEVRAGNLEAAHKILSDSLAAFPDNQRILSRLGQLEMRMGRPAQAIERFEAAVRANPDDVQSRVFLARLHLQSGAPQRALDVAVPAEAANPDNPALLDVLGRAYQAIEQNDEAVTRLRKLVELRPDNLQARLLLIQSLGRLGEIGQAREQSEKALETDPDNFIAKLSLAFFLVREANLERAKPLLAELEQAAPENAQVHELLGDVAAGEQRFDDALRSYRKAFELRPTSALVIKLAGARQRTGDAGYYATYDTWLANHPDDVAVRSIAANDDLGHQRFDAARRHYETIVEQSPDNVLARNNLAWLLFKAGELQAASAHAIRALDLAPDNPMVQDTAGVVLLASGDVDQSIIQLRKASGRLPDNPEISFHLAQALAKDGNTEEARAILTQVLSKDAQFAEREEAEALLRQLGG
jgi:putative PEP-CTERM system TPR-repeat lipoprotein